MAKKPKLKLIKSEDTAVSKLNLPRIIGVGGQKRAGKDSVCDILVDEFGYEKLSYAANLRILCQRITGVTIEEFTNDDLKDAPLKKPFKLTREMISALLLCCYKDYSYMFMGLEFDKFLEDAEAKGIYRHVGTEFVTPRHVLQLFGTELIRTCIKQDFHLAVVFNYIENSIRGNIPHKGVPRFCISDCRFPNERHAVTYYRGITLLITSPTDSRDCIHPSETNIGTEKDYFSTFHNVKEGLDKLRVDFPKFIRDLKFNPPTPKM